MEELKFNRAQILFEQKRFKETEEVLRDLLGADPNNVLYLQFLAETLALLSRLSEGIEIVNRAIGLCPDFYDLFFLKARILADQGNIPDAEWNVKKAISLNPLEANFYAFWAELKLFNEDYSRALEIAERSLEIEPNNLEGLSARSSALLKLKKRKESNLIINQALREDPNNIYTHTTFGWNLLEIGDHKKALEHFKIALSIDPDYDYAKEGFVEAVKATNPVYRIFLAYAVWIGKMMVKYHIWFVLVFLLGLKTISDIAKSVSILSPLLHLVLIGLVILTLSSWVIGPIGNVFLRFSKYGQTLMDEKEKRSADFVTGSIVLLIFSVIWYVLTNQRVASHAAFYGYVMLHPFSFMYSPSRYKNAPFYYAIGMAILGFIIISYIHLTGQVIGILNLLFIICFLGFHRITDFLRERK